MKISKKLRLMIRALVILGILSFIIIESVMVFSAKSEERANVDYLIILGAGLRGEELSLSLQKRMEKGVEYLVENPEALVIVSGGQGVGEAITEAEAMRRYLVAHGIEDNRIIKEEKSTSTMENFKYTKEIIIAAPNENMKLLIVTNDFHIFRSKMLARRNGFIAYGLPCETPLSILPNCYIREYFAVLKSFVLDR